MHLKMPPKIAVVPLNIFKGKNKNAKFSLIGNCILRHYKKVPPKVIF
jgi:hypothetical protein